MSLITLLLFLTIKSFPQKSPNVNRGIKETDVDSAGLTRNTGVTQGGWGTG